MIFVRILKVVFYNSIFAYKKNVMLNSASGALVKHTKKRNKVTVMLYIAKGEYHEYNELLTCWFCKTLVKFSTPIYQKTWEGWR
jgi:hypothetical protein